MRKESQKILIIGALGFIGSHLLKSYYSKGHSVIGLSTGRHSNFFRIPEHLQKYIVIQDLDIFLVHHKNTFFDLIINCSSHGNYSWQSNISKITQCYQDLAHILDFAKTHNSKLLNLGSSSEYGVDINFRCEFPLNDPCPSSLYGATKSAQFQIIRFYGERYRVPCAHLRLFSVYGPLEHPDRLIPNICKSLIHDNSLTLSSPQTEHDFVFIEDAVDAIETIANKMTPDHYGKAFNVCSGSPTTLKDIAFLLNTKFLKLNINWSSKLSRNWDLSKWSGNPDLTKKLFNWTAKTTFEVGLLKTLDFYKKQNSYIFNSISYSSDTEVSIIITCYNHSKSIEKLVYEISTEMKSYSTSYEIIILDDADQTNSFEKLIPLVLDNPSITLIRNQTNQGSQYSILRAFNYTNGQAIVTMDGDGQDPVYTLIKLISKWKKGSNIVLAKRTNRKESYFMNASRCLFYRIWNLTSIRPIPLDVGDFSIVDRALLHELLENPPKFFTWRSYRLKKTTCPEFVEYTRPASPENISTNSILRLIQWSLLFITSTPNTIGIFLFFISFFALLNFSSAGLISYLILLISILIILISIFIEISHRSQNHLKFKKSCKINLNSEDDVKIIRSHYRNVI